MLFPTVPIKNISNGWRVKIFTSMLKNAQKRQNSSTWETRTTFPEGFFCSPELRTRIFGIRPATKNGTSAIIQRDDNRGLSGWLFDSIAKPNIHAKNVLLYGISCASYTMSCFYLAKLSLSVISSNWFPWVTRWKEKGLIPAREEGRSVRFMTIVYFDTRGQYERFTEAVSEYFSLQMHAKLELAHRLQTLKMRCNHRHIVCIDRWTDGWNAFVLYGYYFAH